MTCYAPLMAYHSGKANASGKFPLVFSTQGPKDRTIEVPCGQCIGCRLERSRQWAVRCSHEAQMHVNNCFITLTFNEEHMPKNGSVDIVYMQKFLKRLRKKYTGLPIRFFACGEYGEQLERPHHHAILFGFDFPDKYHFKTTKTGEKLYRSTTLEELWSDPLTNKSYGYSSIGSATFESMAYVARYIMKKVTTQHENSNPDYDDHYEGKNPEFVHMSTKPGIGTDWYAKFCSDVYPSDEVIIRNRSMKPPKFYDKRLEKFNPTMYENIKAKRLKDRELSELQKKPSQKTWLRLKQRELHKAHVTKQLKRPLDQKDINK